MIKPSSEEQLPIWMWSWPSAAPADGLKAPQKTPHATFPSQWTQTSTLTPVWTDSMLGCFHRVPAFTFCWRPLSNLFTAHKWKALKELPLFTPNTHFIEKINTKRIRQHSQTMLSLIGRMEMCGHSMWINCKWPHRSQLSLQALAPSNTAISPHKPRADCFVNMLAAER